jgi:hypothetical protein
MQRGLKGKRSVEVISRGSSVRIKEASCKASPAGGDFLRLSAQVEYDDRPGSSEEHWFDISSRAAGDWHPNGNPWLAALLPLGCQLNQPLILDDPVDERLLEGAHEIMRIWKCWHKESHIIQIEAAAKPPPSKTPSRAGSFFSGGVDSFYTVLTHEGQAFPVTGVDDLISVWGFDIPVAASSEIAVARAELEKAATDLGKTFVEISTNIRETRAESVPWGPWLHGAALAAVGLCLEQTCSRIFIPSSYSYSTLTPWGSHAVVDPLWSTASLRFYHDGAQCTRIEKLRLLAESPVAMRHLRVCWKHGTAENCMECDKCFRTMLALEAIGAREKCSSFDTQAFSLTRLAERIVEEEGEIGNLETMFRSPICQSQPALAHALELGIKHNKRHFNRRRRRAELEMKPVIGRILGWMKERSR